MSDQKFLNDLVAELSKLNKDKLANLLQGMTENKQEVSTLQTEVNALKSSKPVTPNLYVVSSGKSGDTFWKKYNNGLIEEFGWIAPSDTEYNRVNITFPIPFSSQPRLLVTKHNVRYCTRHVGGIPYNTYIDNMYRILNVECGYHLNNTGFTIFRDRFFKPDDIERFDSNGTDWYAFGF